MGGWWGTFVVDLGRKGGSMSVTNILWAVVAIVVILWLLGWTVANLGNIVHLLLVIALIIIVYNLIAGRRAV